MNPKSGTKKGIAKTLINMRDELEMHCNTHYTRIDLAYYDIRKSQEVLEKLEPEFLKLDLLVKAIKN